MIIANAHLPELLHRVLNNGVEEAMKEQISRNEWEAYADPEERKMHPDAVSWDTHDRDQALKDWQKVNCQ